jgi:hypothetical protein
MVNAVGRPKESASWLNRPVACDDADALPSMFLKPRTAALAARRRGINRGGRFSPYIVVLFLLAVAPVQVTLLKSRFSANEEEAIDRVLVVAKRSAAEIGNLLSVPSAEAATTSRSKSIPSALTLSFGDGQWSEAVDTLKLLLAEQNASAMKPAENDALLGRLEAWVNKGTQKSADAATRTTLF